MLSVNKNCVIRKIGNVDRLFTKEANNNFYCTNLQENLHQRIRGSKAQRLKGSKLLALFFSEVYIFYKTYHGKGYPEFWLTRSKFVQRALPPVRF